MNVKKEQIEKNIVQLEIEVDAVKFEEGMQKSYIKNVKKFNIPGFRKGKAPRKLIETYYSEAVFYEDAINFICPSAYDEAVKETEIEPVEQPEIDIVTIGNGENLVFTAKVTVKPEVELGEYKGIEVAQSEYNVTEEDIEKELKAMQEKNSRLVTVDDRAIENGDQVNIDFEGFIDGEAFAGGKGTNHNLEIGSGQFIPGFEDQLIGKNAGDDCEVNVVFPEEYHAPEFAGKLALFNVKINKIQVKELPLLDDEFAKDVSEFDTLDQVKEDIRKKQTDAAENKAKHELENAVVDKVVENASMEIPQIMIEQQIDTIAKDINMRLGSQGLNLEKYLQYTGKTMEQFREENQEQAQKQVKTNLTLEAIAKKEAMEVNEEEIEQELDRLSENYKMEKDKLKKILREEGFENVREELKISKTVDFLVANAHMIKA